VQHVKNVPAWWAIDFISSVRLSYAGSDCTVKYSSPNDLEIRCVVPPPRPTVGQVLRIGGFTERDGWKNGETKVPKTRIFVLIENEASGYQLIESGDFPLLRYHAAAKFCGDVARQMGSLGFPKTTWQVDTQMIDGQKGQVIRIQIKR
jgi:hypothetical protein